ncbi:hypothetical protein [Pectobacterium versatile]|uniref:hypothetical protein n=1 Tax=Pectobacterium versatile TaxID=2488639 RepID=UPI000F64FB9B|nr:hypothetical protein [Pectobacterium versatile]AZK63914.1 hypothetical protein EIP93_17300 [Pectobacterium versatile]
MDLKIFSENIKSTGFILENMISSTLSNNKWNVINNKYYIDDVAKTAREIDIIAYKATKVEDVFVYTTLIISCKKNEEKVWALLSRELNKNDPNIDLEPQHNWSNHPLIIYQLSKNNIDKKNIPTGKLYLNLFEPNRQVFAFQEMFKKNGRPDNDKNIFNSISSLMKSQSYEIDSLPKRKKDRCVYFFYLISIIDSELILIDCSSDDLHTKEIDSQIYISNYIINGESVSSKINFMTTTGFNRLITDYSKLHNHNCNHIEVCYKDFLDDAIKSHEKREILTNELKNKYNSKIRRLIYKNLKIYDRYEITGIWECDGKIEINVESENNELIDTLNGNDEIISKVTEMIEDIFKIKVDDKISFGFDIPF